MRRRTRLGGAGRSGDSIRGATGPATYPGLAKSAKSAPDFEPPFKERISGLLNSEEFSDCTFQVDDQVIKAHRAILAAVSPVFKAMLSDRWGSNGKEIIIADIEYDVFMDMLRYCYSDKLTIKSYKHACNLLYAFKKYMIDGAANKCRESIKDDTCMDNAVQMYIFCNNMQEEELCTNILQYICINAQIILKKRLKMCNGSLLSAMLEKDYINANELSLIKLVIRWAVQICRKERLEITPQNLRRILDREGILKSVRFLSLGKKGFGSAMIMLSGILTEKEIETIMILMNQRQDEVPVKEHFSLCPNRQPRQFTSCPMFVGMRNFERAMPALRISRGANVVTVRVKSNKTILMHGITIPTQSTPAHYDLLAPVNTYSEKICWTIAAVNDYDTDKNDENTIYRYEQTLPYNTTICIYLNKPYLLRRNVLYIFSFHWEPLNFPITYKADCRSGSTHAAAGIQYDDCGYNNSFLMGIQYSL